MPSDSAMHVDAFCMVRSVCIAEEAWAHAFLPGLAAL